MLHIDEDTFEVAGLTTWTDRLLLTPYQRERDPASTFIPGPTIYITFPIAASLLPRLLQASDWRDPHQIPIETAPQHLQALFALFRSQILSQIPLYKKKIPHHIKMPANA
jgi:hypothetical protein